MSADNGTTQRKQYSIVRYSRIRDMTTLRHVSNHNTRAVVSENVRRDGPVPQELLDDGNADITIAARRRIGELGLSLPEAVRDGKVLAVEVFMGASPEFFDQATTEEIEDWYRSSTDFVKRKFGRALLSVIKHEDEKTPHLQAVALAAVEKKAGVRGRPPKDPERRRMYDDKVAASPLRWTFSYNDLLGGAAARLSDEQDDYNAYVRHLGLARGEPQKEVSDLVLDNGVVVAAARVSRGKRQDGTDRPARHFTTQEYQAETRRDRAKSAQQQRETEETLARAQAQEQAAQSDRAAAAADRASAAEARALADVQQAGVAAASADLADRELAMADGEAALSRRIDDADQRALALDAREATIAEAWADARREEAAASAAHAEADRLQAGLAAARAAADTAVREADEDRHAAAAARAEAEREWVQHQQMIVARTQELDAMRASILADRAAAEHHRRDLEALRLRIAETERRTVMNALDAERTRRDAEVVHAAAVSEREAAATARRHLDERLAIQMAQLSLLVRAADDDNGLDLCLKDSSFTMQPKRMHPAEQVASAKPWSPAMVLIGRALATALQHARDIGRRLGLLEKELANRTAQVQAREAQVERDRADDAARRLEHEAAVARLVHQRTDVAAAEARATAMTTSAAGTLAAADAQMTKATAALAENRRWMQVMDALEGDPEAIEVVEGGALRLDRYVAAARPDIASAFKEQPPTWVASLAVQRLDLADALKRAAERENEAELAAERLADMLKQAGPVLTPVQQETVEQASATLRRFDPRGTELDR